jgi:hypothetical protein
MLQMAKKTVPFTSTGIATLPNDKPVLYKILTDSGKSILTGGRAGGYRGGTVRAGRVAH